MGLCIRVRGDHRNGQSCRTAFCVDSRSRPSDSEFTNLGTQNPAQRRPYPTRRPVAIGTVAMSDHSSVSINDVVVPRLNANDDQVLVADIFVAENEEVKAGNLLFVVESTKASVEVLAPGSGRVSGIAVAKGDLVDVGSRMCLLRADDSSDCPNLTKVADVAGGQNRITAKARLRAAELGIDVEIVPPTNGIIGSKEVEAFADLVKDSVKGSVAKVTAATRQGNAFVIGGGDHAATLIDALQSSGWSLVGCTDAQRAPGSPVAGGVEVIGTDEIWNTLRAEGIGTAFIGVGGATSNEARRRVFENAAAAGFTLPLLIARSATFGIDSRIGIASYVLPGAIVGPRCTIGANALINSGAIVCHDSELEDHAHIAPGAVLAGGVLVGAGTTIGMAATVIFRAKIGRNCLIHNGAAVTGDISDNIEFTRDGQRIRR